MRGYNKVENKNNEPLILEPEDWTEEEYKVLLKVFGCPENTTSIKVKYSSVEWFEEHKLKKNQSKYVMIVTSEDGRDEGLFYQVYERKTGKRIGYGTIDPDYPKEDIEEWEKEKIKEGEGNMENQERITLSFTDDIGYTEFKVLKSWYNIHKDNMTVEKMYFVASGDEESGFIS